MKLIDKSALLAEIEIRIKSMEECFNGKFPMSQSVKETEQDKGKLVAYKSILSFSDTLEVKEVDLEENVRQVIDWYLEAGKYYNGIIKKERDECGGSDFAIKLLNGLIDAKELGIQYVLDKLKAQKGE